MHSKEQIHSWLAATLATEDLSFEPASSDASFRRYFRVRFKQAGEDRTLILMDAPPDKEDTGPFIKVATMLAEVGVNVPLIKAKDIEKGFLLLTDLGHVQYLSKLREDNVEQLYGDALHALLLMQEKAPRDDSLPPYDHALLMREMELFREWYVGKHLDYRLSPQQSAQLDEVYETLAQSALAQPQVFVHRDYHSRNLMLEPANNPGIIDFQDAVVGAVTYDLVSLLRDCYIDWPRARVENWALDYLHKCMDRGIISKHDDALLLQWFDWMGVQRHLKATGIFARLNHRDGKPGYLQDIPRTLGYVKEVASRYEPLSALRQLLEELPSGANT